jgi:DNA polymerase-3 subunit epsilon
MQLPAGKPPLQNDTQHLSFWALKLLQSPSKVVCLDTETTGLGSKAQVCEIAVVNLNREILLNTFVCPTVPNNATHIHGISDEQTRNAPLWSEVYTSFCRAVNDRHVLIYNAAFDRRIIRSTSLAFGLPTPQASSITCAMAKYSDFVGERTEKGTIKKQKLPFSQTAHNALSDALAIVDLIYLMAEASL